MELSEFTGFAQYLMHPLVLVGFTLMLVFGVHRELIKSGLLPKLTKKQGSKVVQLILQFGFRIGFAVLVLGILLQLIAISVQK